MRGRLIARDGMGTIAAGLLAAALVAVWPDPSLADFNRRSEPSDQKDPQLAEGEQSVKRGDYATAIRLLEAVVARDQRNADAYNLLAYSIRRSLGDLAKAKEHLAALDKLCFLPCEEYSDLKKAVQEYEATQGRIKPMSKATP